MMNGILTLISIQGADFHSRNRKNIIVFFLVFVNYIC